MGEIGRAIRQNTDGDAEHEGLQRKDKTARCGRSNSFHDAEVLEAAPRKVRNETAVPPLTSRSAFSVLWPVSTKMNLSSRLSFAASVVSSVMRNLPLVRPNEPS